MEVRYLKVGVRPVSPGGLTSRGPCLQTTQLLLVASAQTLREHALVNPLGQTVPTLVAGRHALGTMLPQAAKSSPPGASRWWRAFDGPTRGSRGGNQTCKLCPGGRAALREGGQSLCDVFGSLGRISGTSAVLANFD